MEENSNIVEHRKKWPLIIIVGTIVFGILVLLFALLFSNQAMTPTTIISKTSHIGLNLLVTGLTSPTDIVASPDQTDKRLFILEQIGHIRIIDKDNQLVTQPFLDISDKTLDGGEMGLLGLVFHPDYKQNGYFYINYIDKAQETIIARYKVSSQTNIADPNSEKILLKIKQPYANHNGGDLKFGPDGFLYIALGDGGSAGDPENRSQDKNSFFGKILRIDVNKGDPYSIPSTNPFINQSDARPEIWAYGLRNPWRFSFDKTTGDMYIADVGQNLIEEVDIQSAGSKGGANYGWRCFEGDKAYNSQGCLSYNNYAAPAFEYTHEDGRCSITGGYIYRGTNYPLLSGKYFYGDYCGGQLYYAEKSNGKWQQTLVVKTPYQFNTFGQDNSGELYAADYKTGSIYQIVDMAS